MPTRRASTATMMFIAVTSLAGPERLQPHLRARRHDSAGARSMSLAVILLGAYVALPRLHAPKTHPEVFASEGGGRGEHTAAEWSVPRAVATLVGGLGAGAAWMSEILVGAARGHRRGARHVPGLHRHRASWRSSAAPPRAARRSPWARKNRLDLSRRHRPGQLHPDRAVRGARAGAGELLHRARAAAAGVRADAEVGALFARRPDRRRGVRTTAIRTGTRASSWSRSTWCWP